MSTVVHADSNVVAFRGDLTTLRDAAKDLGAHLRLSAAEREILCALVAWQNGKLPGEPVPTTLRNLAQEGRCTERTAQRALDRLEAMGLIAWRQPGTGHTETKLELDLAKLLRDAAAAREAAAARDKARHKSKLEYNKNWRAKKRGEPAAGCSENVAPGTTQMSTPEDDTGVAPGTTRMSPPRAGALCARGRETRIKREKENGTEREPASEDDAEPHRLSTDSAARTVQHDRNEGLPDSRSSPADAEQRYRSDPVVKALRATPYGQGGKWSFVTCGALVDLWRQKIGGSEADRIALDVATKMTGRHASRETVAARFVKLCGEVVARRDAEAEAAYRAAEANEPTDPRERLRWRLARGTGDDRRELVPRPGDDEATRQARDDARRFVDEWAEALAAATTHHPDECAPAAVRWLGEGASPDESACSLQILIRKAVRSIRAEQQMAANAADIAGLEAAWLELRAWRRRGGSSFEDALDRCVYASTKAAITDAIGKASIELKRRVLDRKYEADAERRRRLSAEGVVPMHPGAGG